MRKILRLLAVLAALALSAGACGDDDGDAVRETGAGSGSAGASASGAAGGSGSASGTAAKPGDCRVEDGVEGTPTGEVLAELTEYAIELAEKSVKAGKIKFEAENAGKEAHEIAIIRTDDVTKLPLTADGAVDDAAIGDALIGEIEPFAAASECEGTFELEAGEYAVICNIVEEKASGEKEAHFKEGMHTTLTVAA